MSTENPQRVYYKTQDYIGIWKRIFIALVDYGLLIVILIAQLVFIYMHEGEFGWLVPLWVVISYLYLTLIKRSNFRSFGYKLFKARIVDLEGKRPSIWKMTLRILLAIIGPLNILLDFMWMGGDKERQALRDKFSQTYVIKKDAQPAGTGPIKNARYFLMGWSFIFPEIQREESV